MPTEFPECEKMEKIKDKSQVIGEFMEWLTHERSVRIELSQRHDISDELMPFNYNIEKLLAEFFEIDLDKVDTEKRQILEDLRRKS